ncbi:MAG: hypothetical protein IH971_04495 [Candidatus Marinimicrobia bacterium]|nr:hypothetical protein [Candidatus Neomarinimicrobiota bacterium]
MSEQELNPHRYFLTLHAAYYHEHRYKGHSIRANVLEKLGIEFSMNAVAYGPESQGAYKPDYHRRLLQARLNDFNLLGLRSEMMRKISDRDFIWSTEDSWTEKSLFEIIQKVPFKWREPLPEEPPVFGSEEFNRYASHPIILRELLSKMNLEELERARTESKNLQKHINNALINSRLEFTNLAVAFFESWFIENGFEVPFASINKSVDIKTADLQERGSEKEASEYIFRPYDGYWQISYGGRKDHTRSNNIGLFYIKELLRKPRQVWEVREIQDHVRVNLYAKNDEIERATMDSYEIMAAKEDTKDDHNLEYLDAKNEPTHSRSHDFEKVSSGAEIPLIQDKKYLNDIKRDLLRLEKKMKQADSEGDDKAFDRAKKEYEKLNLHKRRISYKGISKELIKDQVYAYHNVQRAISRELSKLKYINRSLYEHLKEHINVSTKSCSYGDNLEKPPSWIT